MLEQIVGDYEFWRQEITRLQDLERELRHQCLKYHESVTANRKGIYCHEFAWEYFMSADNLANYSGHGFQKESSYDEILQNVGCEHCVKARKIKIGELSDAKKQFGVQKRLLSHRGKMILNKKPASQSS